MTLWSPCCMHAALRLRVLLKAGYTSRAIIDLEQTGEYKALADLELEGG